mmetsp:Transcript_39247/g.99469  ORF Transcript_39247/g.99469 Transcript_39247/m.99469 type:complete len:324 (-) Transcript_39247:859-1830(-)
MSVVVSKLRGEAVVPGWASELLSPGLAGRLPDVHDEALPPVEGANADFMPLARDVAGLRVVVGWGRQRQRRARVLLEHAQHVRGQHSPHGCRAHPGHGGVQVAQEVPDSPLSHFGPLPVIRDVLARQQPLLLQRSHGAQVGLGNGLQQRLRGCTQAEEREDTHELAVGVLHEPAIVQQQRGFLRALLVHDPVVVEGGPRHKVLAVTADLLVDPRGGGVLRAAEARVVQPADDLVAGVARQVQVAPTRARHVCRHALLVQPFLRWRVQDDIVPLRQRRVKVEAALDALVRRAVDAVLPAGGAHVLEIHALWRHWRLVPVSCQPA